jgi:hypothetical protein
MPSFNATFFLGLQFVLLSAAFWIALRAWTRLGVTFLLLTFVWVYIQFTIDRLDDVNAAAAKFEARAGIEEVLKWQAWNFTLQLFAYFCLFLVASIEVGHLAGLNDPRSLTMRRLAQLHRFRYVLVLLGLSALVVRPYLVKWVAQAA